MNRVGFGKHFSCENGIKIQNDENDTCFAVRCDLTLTLSQKIARQPNNRAKKAFPVPMDREKEPRECILHDHLLSQQTLSHQPVTKVRESEENTKAKEKRQLYSYD